MKKIVFFILALSFFYACNMEELPQAQVSKKPVFGSETGLKMYTNSFYEAFPNVTTIYSNSYYIALNQVIKYFTENGFNLKKAVDGVGEHSGISTTLLSIVPMRPFRWKSAITILVLPDSFGPISILT